ncbi:MAG: gamma-glutamyl-gamma-aminobutyrate hydrolase family protein [Lachnospiraceae bacterium]
MKKPIVGVIPLWDDEKNSIWMLPGYLDGLRQAGCLPMILPLTTVEKEIEQLLTMVDGILFTGGHDVSPELYGEEPLENLVVNCSVRDEMEMFVLKRAMELDKSMLGICRGIQFINAALGGTLYQDIPLQHPSDLEHHQKPPYDVPVHTVHIDKEEPLFALLQKEELEVNSYHHQAVKKLAPGLVAMAMSPDGLIEALYKPDQKFLWALQWHPEFSYLVDTSSQAIFREFAKSMMI